MAVYFISDVHLGLTTRERERKKEDTLLAFLRHILPSTETLFIAGDLFDFWFEYRTVIPKGFHRTLSALQEFTDRGTAVHYLAGNHDYWMGDFLSGEIGCTLHHEPFDIAVQNKHIHLHHGDGLAENDLGYRMIKPILRNRFNIALYRWLHPDIGVRLARGSSRSSREHTAHKDFGEDAGMLEYARKKIAAGTDIVVMGHRHQSHIVKMDGGTYINLGDWITQNTYGELAGGEIALKRWEE